MKKEIGIVGLGKMGLNMAIQLKSKGYRVVGYNRSPEAREVAEKEGIEVVEKIGDIANELSSPRVVLLALPHNVVDVALEEIFNNYSEGDVIIDGANAYFKDSIRRAKGVRENKMSFIDLGVSGGPEGALKGACLMIGGERKVYEEYEELFRDLSVPNGYKYVGASGAGHFVKMIHNGIEYGMMQSIAEGFEILKKSEFDLSLTEVSDLYSNGSVIESRLVEWLHGGLKESGEELEEVSGKVSHSGMGEWTVNTAKEMNIETPAIEGAYNFRLSSKESSFTGKILSLMRYMFGGHNLN